MYEVSIVSPVLSFLMKHLAIGQCPKATNFSAFHWSPHGSLVSIGQHFVTTRVVHLPKRTETSLITESDRSRPNHRIGSGCTGRAYDSFFLFDHQNSSISVAVTLNLCHYAPPQKVAGYYVIPSELLSVCPSVCPSVSG